MKTRTIVMSSILCALSLVAGVYYLSGQAASDLADAPYLQKSRPTQAKARSASPSSTRKASTKTAIRMLTPTLLMREFPRQAVIISQAQVKRTPLGDRSIDYFGSTPETPVRGKAAYSTAKDELLLTLLDEHGTELKKVPLLVAQLGTRYIDYAKLAGTVDAWAAQEFEPSGSLPATSAVAHTEGLGDAPGAGVDAELKRMNEIESLLSQVDVGRSFLAARMLHEEIARSGESAARLSALARAYSHLGDSTRQAYSSHHSIFFARASLYAERAVRLYPQAPEAHAARGYVYTLLGQQVEARNAFQRAADLAAASKVALPTWAAIAEDLSHFKTRALFDRIDASSPDAPLASYFMMLSVEFSGLDAVTVNAARLALKYNAGSLRAMQIIESNSAAAIQGRAEEYAVAENARLVALTSATGAPAAVRQAAANVVRSQFSPDSLRTLFEAMDADVAEPGQLLSWGVYASIWRDELLSTEIRLLSVKAHALMVTPEEEIATWWPLLKDHRFASVLAGFDSTGKLGSARAREFAGSIEGLVCWGGMADLPEWAKQLNPTPGGRPWLDSYDYDSDETTYDLGRDIWCFRDSDADLMSFIKRIKGDEAKWLVELCPDHPLALAELIVNRWDEYADRTQAIERDHGGNPQVAFALARAFRLHDKPDEAVRLFEELVATFPDRDACQMLAELYERRGDQTKWLATMDQYLAMSEDFGIDHASVNRQVAETFMRMQKPERALKYAVAAAEAGLPSASTVLSYCFAEMGRDAEGEAVAREQQESQPATFAWYRWCHATGKGDLQAARAMSLADVPKILARNDDQRLNDLAVFYALEGQADKARDCWQKDLSGDNRSPFDTLMLALLDIESGNTEAAKKILGRAPLTGMRRMTDEDEELTDTFGIADSDLRGMLYGIAISEAVRCLDDPAVVPRRDGYTTAIINARGKPFRATTAYFLGRICELRGKKDDAIWWYRLSLEGEWTNSSRPLAAVALRKLEATTPPPTSP